MITRFILTFAAFVSVAFAGPTELQYLSGQGPADGVKWDFKCSSGRKSGEWDRITVPSNWEQEGFGEYNYGHDKDKNAEIGSYRHKFSVPAEWDGRAVRIVFDGVMTDTEVKVNGKSAGPVHQGGFYRFRYDVSELLNYGGENLLEVEVRKVSQDSTVEIAERSADYWVFGGIFRPVFLEALPAVHVDHLAINAKADGEFEMEVRLGGKQPMSRVTAQIETLEGEAVGAEFSARPAGGQAKLSTQVSNPKQWSAETPNLYQVQVRLWSGNEMTHELTERFGFRTIEVRRGKGLFVNGTRVMLKGVNRHCFRPDTGRALDLEENLEDIELLQSMNMNAVRCSHYPPDKRFLELCDEMGLYVIDELCTWQKPSLGTGPARKLVRELVERDVNHPSILFWANGNEGGWNMDVDDDYHKYDIQKRPVIHPWTSFSGIQTEHYETWDKTLEFLKGPDVFMPTEFLHGLYDGGHGAGLEDYWRAMSESKYGGGGFLWSLADEGIMRTDQGGKIDTDGNHAPDGIVGPNHEKEGSFYTIREIWSPVQFPLDQITAEFSGSLPVENRYDFLTLDGMDFSWELIDYPALGATDESKVVASGKVKASGVEPQSAGKLDLGLPKDFQSADALRVVATDADGREIHSKTWSLKNRQEALAKWMTADSDGAIEVTEQEGDSVKLKTGDVVLEFSKKTGLLKQVISSGNALGLSNGPRLQTSAGERTGVEIKSATASGNEDGRPPELVFDRNGSTHWSMDGDEVWLELELKKEQEVRAVNVHWHKGAARRYNFDLFVSRNGKIWDKVFSGESGGVEKESYPMKPQKIRYLKLVARGSDQSNWTSVEEISLEGAGDENLPTVAMKHDASEFLLDARWRDREDTFRWTVLPGGRVRLDYQFVTKPGDYGYAGIGFDLDEASVKSKQWLGGGPYRVWQNRTKGPEFGLWENTYNDGVPGENWDLPAFKGYFKDVEWMRLNLENGSFTVAPLNADQFVGVLRPRQGAATQNAYWSYPETGGLFFLDVIGAVGTKFHSASSLGPQSVPGKVDSPLEGTIYFQF